MKQIPEDLKDSLLHIATSIINKEIDIIEGCRLMRAATAKCDYGLIDHEVFLPFIAVESETDIYPLGHDRAHYNEKYLMELDKERRSYIDRNSEDMIGCCQKLIRLLEDG